MYKPTAPVVAAIHDLLAHLGEADAGQAAGIRDRLAAELERRRPDLTDVLLALVGAAQHHGVPLERTLTAAAVRAACTRLGKLHPGATIEVRVPPYAAVQIGFETGSRHTRGTPPNVVETTPGVFLELATGATDWDSARGQVRASGAHAADAARAFPL